MQLVLDTKGLKLLKKRSSFLIEPPEGIGKPRQVSPKKLTSIAITQECLISSGAVVLAIQNEIPILFFDRIGKAQARLWSPYFESIATLRRRQIRFCEDPAATDWIVRLFGIKTDEQLRNVKYLKKRKPGMETTLDTAMETIIRQSRNFEAFRLKPVREVRNNIMGNEGTIARVYWRAVADSLPTEYQFKTRSRRPAVDYFNATLNYLYGMLYSAVEGALFGAGLDPHLGILHTDEHNKPTLAFDLIEPFRPWIDRILIEECFLHNLEGSFFTKNQYGLFLNKTGKAYVIPLFNDYLRSEKRAFNRVSTVKNHIYYLAGRLAQRIRTFEEEVEMEEELENEELQTDEIQDEPENTEE